MDQHSVNDKNRNSLRANEPMSFGEPEKIKKLFRALAVLVVFFSSMSLPLYLSYRTQENAKVIRVKMDMNQLNNWAKIYEVQNNDYIGFDNSKDVKRVFKDIESMGGVAHIFISKDGEKYCCKTEFLNKKLGTWCIDNFGSVGGDGKCSANYVQCE